MAVSYDTSEIRQSASRMESAAREMDQVTSILRQQASAAPDALRGEAGDALLDILEKLRSDTTKMSGGMRNVASRLRSFAAYLDMLDRQAKANIQRS